jgi:hypothetical protein
VELALVLPLLMLIILGCVDFGRFAYTYIAVTNASRTGASFGALNPFTTATQTTWTNEVRQKVVDDMSAFPDFDPINNIQFSRSIDAGGLWRVRVQVTYPYKCIVSWPGIPSQVNLTRAVEMRGIR